MKDDIYSVFAMIRVDEDKFAKWLASASKHQLKEAYGFIILLQSAIQQILLNFGEVGQLKESALHKVVTYTEILISQAISAKISDPKECMLVKNEGIVENLENAYTELHTEVRESLNYMIKDIMRNLEYFYALVEW